MTASKTSWKHVPFTHGVSIPYRSSFSEQAFLRLRDGLIPREMEDRWFIYYDTPYLLFHRSWTGQPIYRLTLAATQAGAVVTKELLCRHRAEGIDDNFAALTRYLPRRPNEPAGHPA